MAAFSSETFAPLLADLEAAQTALAAAVETGDEVMEAPSAALNGSRPVTTAAAQVAAATDAINTYIEGLTE